MRRPSKVEAHSPLQFNMASIKAYEPQVDRSLLALLDGLKESQASIPLDEWIGYVLFHQLQ